MEQASFGHAVSTAGDVNGDGYSDVAVIEPGWLGPDRLFIYHGSAAGIGALPATTLILPTEGTQGVDIWTLACAGDVDNDGYSDLVIGRPWYSTVNNQVGRAYVYHGSPSGLEATPRRTLTGSRYDARFGCAVASAGNVNGDLYSDIVIGEPGWQNGQPYEGRVAVYHGSATGIGASPSWSYESDHEGAEVGLAVSWAGDVNGDGYGDIIAGEPYYEEDGWNPTRQGRALCFHGSASGLAASPARTWVGIDNDEIFGYSMSGAGDVNGDGYADVIIGSPGINVSYRGAASVFLGSPTGLPASAAWRVAAPILFSEVYGHVVCTAGDVNGDGYSDVIVGDPKFNAGPILSPVVDAGRAFLYLGSPDGLSTTMLNTRDGPQDHARFGWSVASAGDVNGDGYGDVIIGAPLYDAGQTDEGRAFLYLGAATGLAATATWTAESNQNNAQFGYCVSTAGDVNGHGYGDVIIGAPYYDNGQTDEGRAYIFHGIATGLSAIAAATRESDQANAHFGWSVNTAGDVNGDGYSDVIIGAPDHDNGQTNEGRASVYMGSGGGLGATPWITESDQAGAQLGISVAGGGDVNGDGYGDVIIGVPLYDGAFTNEGQVRIHAGWVNGVLDAPLWTATGGKANSSFGASVAMAGDVDGNGRTDVIVGAPMYDVATATSNEGRACVFLSNGSGPAITPAWTVNGGTANGNFGSSVSKAGDVNGDGYGDILVGEPNAGNGRVRLWHGSPTGPGATAALDISASQAGQNFGASVSHSGSQSGDGYGDVVVGSPRYDVFIPPFGPTYTDRGRANLFLGNAGRSATERTRQYRPDLTTPVQPGNGTFSGDCSWGIGQVARSHLGRRRMKLAWEVTGHGPPFSGTPPYTGESASWANVFGGSEIKEVLATTSTAYPKWRVRVRHHPATMIDGQPYGRWHYFGINDRQEPAVKTATPACGLLPVELIAFDARCDGGDLVLSWTTASEHNSSHFTVRRSGDGDAWEDIGRVVAAGNSQSFTAYAFTDPAPTGGQVLYYRLWQVDLDGNAKEYDAVAAFPCAAGGMALIAFPNPATDAVYVQLSGALHTGPLLLHMQDGQGRIIRTAPLPEDGRAHFDLRDLAPGVYTVTIAGPSAQADRPVRIIKQ